VEDLSAIQQAFTQIRDLNAVSLTFRRGGTTLPAQTVRVERQGTQARQAANAGSEQSSGGVVILGAVNLDVQVADRFTLDSRLYEVTFVEPNRHVATQAGAQLVE
jgi:hypothetical protein